MLAPFSPLLPRTTDVGYEDLARAAKALRVDPAGYRPLAGIDYEVGPETLWRWEMADGRGVDVVGLLGVFPLRSLVPHEATTAAALTRPRHPIQIRPVMALIEQPLPPMKPVGPPLVFDGTIRHTVTPVISDPAGISDAVIADGHHRTAAALRAGGDPGIMTMIVSTAAATLEAGSFHRVFAHPIPLPTEVPGANIHQQDPIQALAAGRIAVVTPAGSVGLEMLSGPLAQRYDGIPAGWAHHALLPALGLDEADAVYLDDADAAIAAAHYGAAILLPGSKARAVIGAARSGVLLPPKATRFRPKPLRGFVMRSLVPWP